MKEYTIVLESFVSIEAEDDDDALNQAGQEELIGYAEFSPRIIERKDEKGEVMVY